ncbi:MAG: IscS subfamily cysteine desulfurase [Gammaproteobacteria bacterium]|uniref:IscS subfamily cysteine desulfurase n=1 Tax=Stutzerimonas xanthomarina TaxID=271420 RepID=UPI00190B6021|nr:IscS subfamily cysteine desulfurase [Stutzerimonas xanthomarina]MBU0852613.1 IscS subfamily cysteine desulfurase [Gammaproteobacteria bacterium]MBK3848162.1 IscS subfamily cysteine desulfurase [Stutzerimonas xanthomarina]MBU1301241.1 IscS subfamily cysteine desulfurase [Gammaproteobacteria bacterium]MBU1459640.1 IscS subfamily cysteine desulfurase [Gammaproteobacteria bacterium]MBU1774054.1 IscS subfamily cysteine desulfurase [Gammaproteobacteria bacterium]|tara:strand:- start:23752 stop:24966 length:1215 start_codon:yes stop_codon:yes gene_type:complete
MKLPIYLDYSATTPVDPRVAEKMVECLTAEGNFGNPASRSHAFGWKAEEAVENARRQVAELVNADPREIVWTSGATESDNLAIKGAAHFYASKGKHIVTSKIEHKAVLDTTRQLEREGFEVTYIEPGQDGVITPAMVEAALRDDTVLVSIMHVNNEIGTINDIAAIGELTRSRGVLFHVDAAQSTGKVEIDLEKMKVDLMSFSAHKTYGPKGVGALYVRRKPRVRLEAQMHGGGHERGMRSGTLAAHQSVGMGEAFRIAKEEMAAENERITQLRDRFFKQVEHLEELYVNGSMTARVPHNLNLSFNYVEGESLIMALKDLAVSSGSACTSASLEPSYVLRALGRNDELAHSSIRFTFGRFTTEEEVDYAAQKVSEAVTKLRELSPLWDMFKDGVDISQVEWAAH